VLVAGAVCPHPPLLVPEAMGAAGLQPESEMDTVRAACDAAVAGLVAAEPDVLVVVGGAAGDAAYDGSAAGSLRDYGISYTAGNGEAVLPLSLTIGLWLLSRAGLGTVTGTATRPGTPGGPGPAGLAAAGGHTRPGQPSIRLRAVAHGTPAAGCLRLGQAIASQAPRVAMLAMGDGPARRAAGVPGAPDPAAERYDAEAAAALAAADPGRLARLAAALDDELMVSGRAAWQVLAGAAGSQPCHGDLRYAAAPLLVSYLVASWDCHG
jgi:hypothetical protein